MADDEILAVLARRRLYEFVRANPGFPCSSSGAGSTSPRSRCSTCSRSAA